MASIQASADYTDRDFAALRVRLRALIRSVFPTWTDFQITNFGNLLVNFFAWTADILGFYQDAQAAEAFLPTATQRRSLLKLAALVGYKPVGASAASTVETFTAEGLTADCVIPAGTIVTTLSQPDPVEFQTLSPITLTVSEPSKTVSVEHSKSQAESFSATGQPNLSIVLGQTPYLDDSIALSTAQGAFEEVASFVNADPSDKVFVVKVDDNDRATVVFGDGVTAGLIPTGTISVTYKTGGGKVGNVAAHSIQNLPTPLLDIHGATVNMSVDNDTAATGGTDREGAESIRQAAPAWITAPAVSVARTDFEVHARGVAGVDRALYLTQNEDDGVPINTGYLFLVCPGPSGPDRPSVVLKDKVRRQFTDDEDQAPFPMMATQALGVYEAPFLDIDVEVKVYFKKTAVVATVADAIRASLVTFFSPKVTNEDGTVSDNPLINFGYYLLRQSAAVSPVGILAESDIANAIRDTAGVREIGPNPADLTLASTLQTWNASTLVFDATALQAAARQDITVPTRAFPRLGTVTVVNGDTGLTV